MRDQDKTKEQLIEELTALRHQLLQRSVTERSGNQPVAESPPRDIETQFERRAAALIGAKTQLEIQCAERTAALIGSSDQVVMEVVGRHQVEQALQTARHQLQEVLEAKSRLEQHFAERTEALIGSSDQLVAEVVSRHHAEQALLATRDQLQTVLEAIPGIVSWIGSDLRYRGVNSHLAQIFGLEPEEFVDQDIGFLNTSSSFNDFVRRFFQDSAQDDVREITALVDKTPRTYLIVSQKYEQGQAALTVGIDITDRKQAEEDLQSTKDQLQTVLGAVPGIVSWIGSDLRYRGVNHHLADLFNMEPEDFIGQDLGFLQTGSEFDQFIRDFFASPEQDKNQEISTQIGNTLKSYLIVAQKYDQGRAAFTIGVDITDRKQAEANLQTTTVQLEAILETVPGIVSWIGSNLRYLGVNRELAATFDLTPEEFVGQDIGFLQSSSEFKDFVREFFESPHQDDSCEISAMVKQEQRNYLIVVQKYNQGQAAFAVGIDITQRKRAEEAVRLAEAKYRNIFENTVEGIFQTTLDGRYLSANPALARIYGYASPAELTAQLTDIPAQLYVDSGRRAEFVQILQEQGSVVDFESQIRRRDGQLIWISENARTVCQPNGELDYYEGTVEDITARKRAEDALQRANEQLEARVDQRTAALTASNQRLVIEIAERQRAEAALRTSEADLRSLFAAMTDIIAVFDAQGHYIQIVSTNSELLYSPDTKRVGKKVHEVLPSQQATLFTQHIQQALSTQKTVSLEYSLPITEQSLAGTHDESDNPDTGKASLEELWFSARVSPMSGDRVIWVARDITERKRAEEALAKSEQQLRQQNRELVKLAQNSALNRGDLRNAVREITEVAAYTLDAERASVWLLNEAGVKLQCVDLFEKSIAFHSEGTELDAVDYPAYFEALEEDRVIALDRRIHQSEPDGPLGYSLDSDSDSSGTASGIASMLDAPIRLGGQIVGMVSLEQLGQTRHWTLEEQNFVGSMADLVSLAVEARERRRAEQALQKAEEKYRSIFEQSVEGIGQTTPEGHYINANPALARMYGYDSPDALIADQIDVSRQLYVDPDRRTAFIDAIEAEGSISNFESEVYRQDGSIIWISESARAVTDPTGNLLYYEGSVEDITKRKEAETALRESEERYRFTAENSGDMISRHTSDGYYTYVSPASLALLGYNPAELMGRSMYDYIHPDSCDAVQAAYQAMLAQDGTSQDNTTICSYQIRHREGHYIWFETISRMIHNSSIGDVNEILASSRDITARKQAEEALRTEQEKSERLLLNILPKAIADRLKQSQESIADRFEDATILFADIVDFTSFSAQIAPTELVDLLNDIFSCFDALAEDHGLEKIKTIGDAYMVVGGIPTPTMTHPAAVADMALAMRHEIQHFRRADKQPFQLRIGINTGPVVAGVIGTRKFNYDLWGDAVNVASRMEVRGQTGKIQVTASTYERLKDNYLFEKRGLVDVKGKGKLLTYWLCGKK